MKKNYFILVVGFILLFLSSCGQNNNNSDDITNNLSEKHKRILGSHLYIIPPKDFKMSNAFIGMTNDINVNIAVTDLYGGNIYSNAKDFTKDHFEKQGLTIYDFKEFKLNNSLAKYMHAKSYNSNDENILLIFGDSTFSVSIIATFYQGKKENFDDVKKSLLTAFYDDNLDVDPFETANFDLDLTESNYKFEQFVSGQYIFKKETENDSKLSPFFLVIQMPYKEPTVEKLNLSLDQMINGARNNGTNIPDFERNKIKIKDYNAIETYGIVKNINEEFLYYLLVVGKEDSITIINSAIHSEYDDNLRELKDVLYKINLK